MDIEAFRKAGHEAVDKICDYYASLEQRPVGAQVKPGFLREAVPDEAPEKGEEWSVISKDYDEIILPGITHWQAPGFMAYFPANATFEGCLADLHAAAISNPAFNWSCSPSVTELEILVLDWIAKALHLSPAFLSTSEVGGGIILGSASEVAVTVMVAARERALAMLSDARGAEVPADGGARPEATVQETGTQDKDLDDEEQWGKWRGDATGRLVAYGTTQTHSIGSKACLILGLAFRALEVKAEDGYALRGDVLRNALEEDTAKGRVPFMLIGTFGTTSSGAVDNLQEIGQVAKDYPMLWLHCDAAYAGVAMSLPEVREASTDLAAINECFDSYSTNMHKWGLVQFDCSPLFVRDRGALTRALTVTPEYLRTKHGDAGSVLDLRNMQISLGRRFRSLKVWFVLRSFGLEGFRAHLRNGISLAQGFAEQLREHGEPFAIVAPPRYALVVFRLDPTEAGGQSEELDALNRRFWEAIQEHSKEIQLTQTVLPEIGFCIRLVVGAPSTRQQHVDMAWRILRDCADRTLKTQPDA